jgi:predicted metallo-beta-lactamase superfamily hydrolase
MKQDRTYWRSEPAERLIEEGKASGDELAIALAERLEDKDRNLEAVRDELHRHMREDD